MKAGRADVLQWRMVALCRSTEGESHMMIGVRIVCALVFVLTACSTGRSQVVSKGARVGSGVFEYLPLGDQRVPWSAEWRSIRYRPDFGAVALVGWPTKALPKATLRSDVSKVSSGVLDGLQIYEWAEDSELFVRRAPAEIGYPEPTGAWALDSTAYAHVFRTDAYVMYLFSEKTHQWEGLYNLGKSTPSNLSWSADGSELAIAVYVVTTPVQDEKPTEDASPPSRSVHICVIGRDGSLRRSKEIAPFTGAQGPLEVTVSWSPDGRYIAVASTDTWTPAEDSGRLALLDARTLDAKGVVGVAGSIGRVDGIPQWNSNGSALALKSSSALRVYNVSEDGELEAGAPEVPLPEVVQAVWVPDGKRLMIVSRERAADLAEVIEVIERIGEGVSHRYAYRIYEYDTGSPSLLELTDYSVTVREKWHNAYMIPRIGEAFSRWMQ